MKPKDIKSSDIRGLKFFKPLQDLLDRLHLLYPNPNRSLHYDQYFCLLLLYYFNPILTSLRGMQVASTLERVQKELGVKSAALGSLSEAAHVFDPEPLRQIFMELAKQACAADAIARPEGLPKELSLIAFDGTLWSYLPRMAPYFWENGPRTGPPPGFKAHLQFNILKGVPSSVDITAGYGDERRTLEKNLAANNLYIIDRGLCDFKLFQEIIDARSSFVARGNDCLVARTIKNFELTESARQAGVYSDELVQLGSEPHAGKLRQPLRVIRARVALRPPHNLNPRRGSGDQDQILDLLLITDQLEMPAELIVQLYHYRWQVEIFFRWLKCTLGLKHFVSECQNGFALQLYAALIAGLLIVVWTGRKPTKRMLEMIQWYLSGWATLEEVLAAINKLKPARV